MPVSRELALTALKKAMRLADEAEVYLLQRKELKIDVLNNKLESIDNLEDSGLAVRVIKNKVMGFAYTSDMHEDTLSSTVEQAVANAKGLPDDKVGFAGPAKRPAPPLPSDPEIESMPLQKKTALAFDIESSAYEFDKNIKKSEKISYEDVHLRTILLNSCGVDIQHERSFCGAYASVIAEKDGEMQKGIWMRYSVRYGDLKGAEIGREAAKRASYMLGAGQGTSGNVPVILAPFAASIIISALSPALSAEFVQKGKSLFAGATGKSVASKKINLVDSGLLADGISSAPYDDEGTPTKETVLINNGTLKGYLHGLYSAKKSNTSSTGNSFRGSFKSQPDICPTNLYIKPGVKPGSEMLASISKGFLVTNIMGAHTINPISGDFSIGFSGSLIENGKLSRPVRGMTIAGNMHDLLCCVEEIGSDLMFFPHNGNVGSPSLLVPRLSVSGS